MYNVEKTQKRKLRGEDDSMPTPKKRGRPNKVIDLMSRYPLERPQEGSNSTADARNMQALQLETEENKRRKKVILPLMKATFYSRQHYILNEAESVVKSVTEDAIPGKMVLACKCVRECLCTCLCLGMGFVSECVWVCVRI